MQVSIKYEKPKVIQALRYHFLTRPEIKILAGVIVIFSLVAGVFLAMRKIQPQIFLLASLLWLGFFIIVFYVLPYVIYTKSKVVFQDEFTASLQPDYLSIQNSRGRTEWPWTRFSTWIESDHFFYLYFNKRSFFLIPKSDIESTEDVRKIRQVFGEHIRN